MKFRINLKSIKCINEINEGSASEEPYVLVTSVKLLTLSSGLQIPVGFEVFRYGVWEDFDKGETKPNAGTPFWGLNSAADTINTRDDVIFIISLMENDNAQPNQYRLFVKAAATISLASSLNRPRTGKAATLITDIRDALNGVDVPFPFVLDDDHIDTQELRLQSSDLIATGSKDKKMRIRSTEGDYELEFRITAVP